MAESAHVLLEGAPKGLDTRHIGPDLVTHVSGVADIHHVHAWSLTHEKTLVTLHARVFEVSYDGSITAQIKSRLRERFDIAHATVEIEHGQCADDEAH
jgi:cobalt-zinc-cadmium efflux system protein